MIFNLLLWLVCPNLTSCRTMTGITGATCNWSAHAENISSRPCYTYIHCRAKIYCITHMKITVVIRSQCSQNCSLSISPSCELNYSTSICVFKWFRIKRNQRFLLFEVRNEQIFMICSVFCNKMNMSFNLLQSRITLTKYMLQLIELGVLSPQTEGKEVFYINNDLIRILQG